MSEAGWLSSILIGSVFLFSGIAKFFEWRRFGDTLAALEIFPPRLARAIARLIPPLEILLGICLITEWKLAVSGRAAFLLLTGFTLTLAIHRWRGGKELTCGCFAEFDEKTSTSSVIARNLLLLVTALPLLPEHSLPPRHGWADWAMAITVVVGIVLSWSMSRRLAGTARLIRLERSYWDAEGL